MPAPWPNTCPPDLRRALDGVLAARSRGAAEVWGEVRDWLERHGVEPPPDLQEEQPPEPWRG